MRRPRMLWVTAGLFGVLFSAFMGLWLWAEYGFERTIIIYETAEAPLVEAVAPRVASVEEPGIEEARPAPIPEAPPWLQPVRWGTMAGAAALAVCVVYLELMHRRRQRGRVPRTRD